MKIDPATGEVIDDVTPSVSINDRMLKRVHRLDVEIDRFRIPHMVVSGYYLFKTNAFSALDVVNNFCRTVLKLDKKNEEYMYMFCLATDGTAIGISELAHGSKSSSVVDPKAFAVRVILSGASSIILVHNHPSGNITSSKSDDETCNKLKKISDLLGVKLHDFIIIGDETFSYNAHDKL